MMTIQLNQMMAVMVKNSEISTDSKQYPTGFNTVMSGQAYMALNRPYMKLVI